MKKIITFILVIIASFSLISCSLTKELPNNISQSEWADAKKYLKLSTGIKMAYVEMGDKDGTPLILQHGMTDNSRSWSLAAPYFAEAGYHVYLPDLRGMGKTDMSDGYYTAVTYATDLKAFFDAKDIDKAILVGHSLGSFTVQTFSILFPERCEKVVLVSSTAIKGYQNEGLMYVYDSYVKNLKEDEHLSDAFMDVWYASELKEDEFADVIDEFKINMKKEAQNLPKQDWINILFGMMSLDMTEAYQTVDHSIPVCILCGDKDDSVTSYQDELKEIFNVGNESYICYSGIGHNIQFEIPHQCATDILRWLDTGSIK